MNNLIPDESQNPGIDDVLKNEAPDEDVFVFPASFGQQRLWFLDQFEPGSPYYNIPMAVRLCGSLTVPVLDRVINEIIRRHESLRTTFATMDNKPVQIIHPRLVLPVLFTDLSNLPKEQKDIESRRILQNEARYSFNLQIGPLIRFHVVKLFDNEHLAMLNMHHIISDGWSVGIFFQELVILYDAFSRGLPSPLPELSLQYADFADWQREWLQGDILNAQLTYWKEQLEDTPPVLELPLDRPRPSVQTNAGANAALDISQPQLERLLAFSRSQGVTLFMTLLTAFQVLLARYSGQDDISVGTPVANRTRGEVEQIIGLFINTLVIRSRLDLNLTFKEILLNVKEKSLGAFAHQDIPFEMLVDALQPEREMSHSPLFQVMFILQNAQQKDVGATASDLTLEQIDVDSGTSTFDITVSATQQPTCLNLSIEYNTDLFDRNTIDRFLEHFIVLLDAAVQSPDSTAATLPLMTNQETAKVLIEWNETVVDFPELNLTIPELFEAQVARTPDQVAVVFPAMGDRARNEITYSALNEKANILANALRDSGVKPESIVGVCLDKSIETVIAILGILKAGGAYLPLDPQYPPERLSFMIDDSKICIMVSTAETQTKLPEKNLSYVLLDPGWENRLFITSETPEKNLTHVNTPEDLVYLIYTSGSTGQAKGVMLEHRNLVNAFLGWKKDYQLGDVHAHLQMANFSFDVFSGDLVRALCSGGKLVLCPRDFLLVPEELFNLITNEEIDIAEFVPAVLRNLIQFLDRTSKSLLTVKLLICGSDSWYAEEYKAFLRFCSKDTRLINSFGLTEATIDSTFYEGSVENLSSDQVVPIGRPFSNTRLYILDNNLQPVPIGVKGELFIGGRGIARGYLNRPELTQEKFIPDPFIPAIPDTDHSARLYRTGDATRYLPDGNIEFLGRIDFQVKIRGFRVETGEIEAVLRQFPGVQDAVVYAVKTPSNTTSDFQNQLRLVGYLVGDTQDATITAVENSIRNRDLSIPSLRLFLKSRLPDYMVPSFFVMMDALPLTPNGKIDRQKLPVPDWSKREVEEVFIPPRNQTESDLAEIWIQVLGLEKVGVYDNFFELGGHSLLATQVISRIRSHFDIDIPLRNIFESPTISSLSEHIDKYRLEQKRVQAPPIVPIIREETSLPLSFAQQRLWFLDQLEPDSSYYNLPESVRLRGPLDVELLEASLNEVIRRHEALRTIFKVFDGEPVQWILPELTIRVPVIDLSNLPLSKREADALHLAEVEVQKPFNLASGPLLRATILRLTTREHIALFTMHHIIGDAWSSQVLIQELTAIYTAFINRQPSPLQELSLQYADFAFWQRNWLKGDVLNEQIIYWKKQLAGLPPLLELATDKARPSVQTFNGAFTSFMISDNLSDRVRNLSQKQGVTLFMLLLAAFQALLYRYTNQDQIGVGTPIANRNRGEIERLIGFFVNTLVLNADFSTDLTFTEFLDQVKVNTLDAYAHQDVPFEMVVDALQPERNLSHSPLFQVMFTLQTAEKRIGDSSTGYVEALSVSPLEVHSGTSKFDLTLFMLDEGERLSGVLEYNTDLFNPDTIDRMIGHFRMILDGATANPDQHIWMLPLLTPAEKDLVIDQWNNTLQSFPDHLLAHHLFEEQVELFADSIAVRQLSITNRITTSCTELSFRELNHKANQLAHYLVRLGIGPEKLVGICLDRSVDLVVSILAVLKSGGAYIPLDPTYPPDRLAYMLEDSRAAVLISQEKILKRFDIGGDTRSYTPDLICIEKDWESIQKESTQNVISGTKHENLAYVIYTSGSTGKPKGAMIEHQGLVNYLLWCKKAYPIIDGQGSPVHSSISFDLTVTSLFTPLISGHCVTLLPEDLGVEGLEILLNQEEDFSLVKITPAHLQLLGEQIVPDNANHRTRAFIIGGENLLVDHIAFWKKNSPETQLVNEYGPTETVVGCCVYWVPDGQIPSGIIPIGKPIINTRLYVLDPHQQPVPVGIPGELYIGGLGVGRGYLNRPDLTSDKYLPDPFSNQPGARMYRSGDLVRYLPDGNLTCLGRIDFQVKIRGFRVELGEVEAVLGKLPDVKDVCVWLHQDTTGKRLVAYLVLQESSRELHPMELRTFLRQELPEYMVPSAFVFLSEMPLTPNGKIDRKALPAPDQSQFISSGGTSALKTPEEEIIASIWAGVLGIRTIGASDNFFELGGHSLLATQVMARIGKAFGVEIPLKYLFEYPTVETLAQQLSQERLLLEGLVPPPILPEPRHHLLPLSFAQQRLWFLDQLSPGTPYYNIPVAVQLKGQLELTALERSLNTLVERHESLRTRFIKNDKASTDDLQVIQVISDEAEITLAFHDLSNLPAAEKNQQADFILQEVALKPFDLANGPLMTCTVIRLEAEHHLFIVNTHHIITDDWSLGIFVQELAASYAAITAGDEPSVLLHELPVQYADFAVWQRNWLKGENLQSQFEYWQKQLSDVPPLLDLPLDFSRPVVQSFNGARHVRTIPKELTQSLRDLSQSQGSTLFMVLLSGLELLLHRYSGQDAFGIGTPIANRTRSEQEGLIGFFVNTLVMKADFSQISNVNDLLSATRRTALDAYAHQDLPFEMLVDRLQPERNLSHTPFFQVMFVLQNAPKKSVDVVSTLKIEPLDFADGIARFDLTVTVVDEFDQLSIAFDYNTDLFKGKTVDRMSDHFLRVLSRMVENPLAQIGEIKFLPPEEEQRLLVDWNQTIEQLPDYHCAQEIFENSVAENPDGAAVIFSGEERRVFSYRELDQKANQLAHYLQGIGVGPEVVVGVSVHRSIELLISVMGILKAGGVYLPLDPHYPVDRLAYMVEVANPKVVLTTKELVNQTILGQTATFYLDDDWELCNSLPTMKPECRAGMDNLAYIIFTSGSTGKPKGVMLLHRGLINLIVTQNGFYHLQGGHTMLQFAALGFDASVWEIFLSLSHGASLVLAPQEVLSSGLELLDLLRLEKIHMVTLPPSLLSVLPPDNLPALHTIISAGEACTKEIVDRWAPGRRFVNAYGPTEATVCTSLTECHANDPLPPSIGKPIGNFKVYVVDRYNQLTPEGVPGELWIGGVALARGYLNRADLTGDKFIQNPFETTPGNRIYRTGDRVRWREDGNLEFLGRIDEQVKIRGFRIELGEIEAVLLRRTPIQQVAVVVNEDLKLGKRLVAFYLELPGQPILPAEFQELLRSELPDYMVPALFIPLDRFPLSPAGKVDKKALAAMNVSAMDRSVQARLYEAPANPEEAELVAIFEDLLGVERVSRHDNFFEMGGHSLLATRVISRIKVSFQVDLPLRILFELPTAAEIAGYIQQQKSELASRFMEEPIPLLPRSIGNHEILQAPLSYAQQRLWFLDQFDPGKSNYNLPIVVKLTGNLDIQKFHASIEKLAQRHEILRSVFSMTSQGVGQQVVLSSAEVPFDVIVVSEADDLTDAIHEEVQSPFQLSEEPAIRFKIFQASSNNFYLVINMHHIISDGWSLGIIIRELVELYLLDVSPAQFQANLLPELPIQYADFAAWQRSWLSGDRLEAEIQYWVDQLADLPPSINLPIDFTRPPIQTFNGQTISFEVPESITAKAVNFCKREGITLFMGLLAVYEILLSRYSGQTIFGVGTPIANRTRSEVEGLIGFFVNTLVMKADVSTEMSLSQFTQQVKTTALEAYAHQDVPFEMLVDRIQPTREMSHSPLFQVVFSLQNNQAVSIGMDIGGIQLAAVDADTGVSKFDLTLTMMENGDRLTGGIEFNTDLFKPESIIRMHHHLLRLMDQAFSFPNEPISSLVMVTESERQMILQDWNQTYYPLSDHATVHELFSKNAELRPDSLAVAFGDQVLTYSELDEKSTCLAIYLGSLGLRSEGVVGVFLEKSPDVLISLLAILKAGGVYLPLDPGYPSSRLSYIVEDITLWQAGKNPVIITHSSLLNRLPIPNSQVICLDKEWDKIFMVENAASRGLERPFTKDNNRLAYIIYTSGSTGKPKGVALHHAGLRNMVESNIRDFGLKHGDGVLQFASLSFDASINEIFLALVSGAKLVMGPRDVLSSPVDLANLLEREGVTFCILPPSLLKALKPSQLSGVKKLVSAGESCSVDIGLLWSRDRDFFNAYGPTEATIGPTLFHVSSLPDGIKSIPIGKPIDNMQVLILDRSLQLLPVGIPGEIFIGGVGLARCYINQPELTAERFIVNPFDPSTHLYKTGDLGKWLPDGNVEYLGRVDFQVKIRGFRIELEEIERVLNLHPAITNAVVLAREDVPGSKRLVAYIVSNQTGHPDELRRGIRSYLQEHIPEYMIPSAFVLLDALPLTPNGKVNRNALPVPEYSSRVGQKDFISPVSKQEHALAEIWQSLLGIDQVSVNDNFFELGGDSILSIQLVARAGLENIKITPRQVFEHPTIAGLVAVAGQEEVDAEQGLVTGAVPLTPVQRRFFAHHLISPDHWNTSLMLAIFQEIDPEILEETLKILIEHHDALRMIFSHSEQGWEQFNRDLNLELPVNISDLSHINEDALTFEIEKVADQAQRSLDLQNGPLMRVLLIRLPEGIPSRLLFIFHHTIFDGVSWRIFIEDFQTVFAQLSLKQPPMLLPKTTSFKEWATRLSEYAQTDEVSQLISIWGKKTGDYPRLPVDFEGGANRYGDSRILTTTLSLEDTELLIKDAPGIFHAQVNEILIGLLARTLSAWSERNTVLIELYGHGREPILKGVDVSRTIGWFTTAYPVLLDLSETDSVDEDIAIVASQLRQIPHHGISYGVLKYLSKDPQVQSVLSALPSPQLNFNYLGQFDQSVAATDEPTLPVFPAPESRGVEQHPENDRESQLFVVASVTGGEMNIYWNYSPHLHKPETIQRLADHFMGEIRSILSNHCRTKVDDL